MDDSVATPIGNMSEVDPGQRSEGDADLASRLAQAQERLAFYESFDTLIQENVRRSGELLRQVAAEQEQADRRMRAMRAEVDQRLAEQRAVLEELASGLVGLQTNLESIADRVSASLSSLPSAATQEVPATPPLVGGEAAPPRRDGSDAVTQAPSRTLDPAAPESVSPEATPPIAAAPIAQSGPGGVSSVGTAMEQPATARPNQEAEVGPTAPRVAPAPPNKIDLIVHGVPNAATALSLQRHIQGLRKVDAVEVREYVSGVLRFQIVATSFGAEDLRGWPGGAGLELITDREHVLELKLPTAEGF